jgi:hypothetical protein
MAPGYGVFVLRWPPLDPLLIRWGGFESRTGHAAVVRIAWRDVKRHAGTDRDRQIPKHQDASDDESDDVNKDALHILLIERSAVGLNYTQQMSGSGQGLARQRDYLHVLRFGYAGERPIGRGERVGLASRGDLDKALTARAW